ncbi:MAG: hypothetical protein ABIW57_13710 [Polyangia bacterium]
MNRQSHSSRRVPPPAGKDAAEIVTVRIDGLAPGGDAVGRQEGGRAAGRVTFVALAAPGDRIQARLTKEKGRVAWADLIAITEPSPKRVDPPCPLFGRCGGCQWQHVALETQRTAKRDIVARALRLPRETVPLLVPAEAGVEYRERAQFVVGTDGALGFRARRSHQVVDVDRCLLLAPALQRVLAQALRPAAASFPPGTELDLQAGREGVHVTVRLAVGGAREASVPFATLPPAWSAAGVVGMRVVDGRADNAALMVRMGLDDVDIAVAGQGEPALRIPAGAFSQVGAAANQALVATVLDQVGEAPGRVLELYAGSGNFTRFLLGRATKVTACEGDPAAVARGRRTAPSADWSNRHLSPPHLVDADTVVVDPPREGLDAENLAAVLQAKRRVVYVSCDPQTLARDAARLAQNGFVLRGAVALDLMPHTYHVEVVATFDRP